jgi:Holliday junction resolvase RusA-like endonuclease
MIGIKIKALSVNEAWQGKRYKTQAYKAFEKELILKLPDIEVPEGKLALNIEIGFSNANSDLSNPLKLIEDILQKKYSFNDNKIYDIHMKKKITKKGAEYIMFEITND